MTDSTDSPKRRGRPPGREYSHKLLVCFTDEQFNRLNRLAREIGCPRAWLIRAAIDRYAKWLRSRR